MILYHVTHRSNVANIKRRGLQRGYCRGKLRAIWLTTDPSKILLEHIAAHHGWRVNDLRIVAVRIYQDMQLRKHCRNKNGLHRNTAFYCRFDIPAYNIGQTSTFERLAA